MRESGIGRGLHWSDPEVCGALTTLHANLTGQKRSRGMMWHGMTVIERMVVAAVVAAAQAGRSRAAGGVSAVRRAADDQLRSAAMLLGRFFGVGEHAEAGAARQSPDRLVLRVHRRQRDP